MTTPIANTSYTYLNYSDSSISTPVIKITLERNASAHTVASVVENVFLQTGVLKPLVPSVTGHTLLYLTVKIPIDYKDEGIGNIYKQQIQHILDKLGIDNIHFDAKYVLSSRYTITKVRDEVAKRVADGVTEIIIYLTEEPNDWDYLQTNDNKYAVLQNVSNLFYFVRLRK